MLRAAPSVTRHCPHSAACDGTARVLLRRRDQARARGDDQGRILKELIGLLKLDDKSEGMLFKMLKRRENLGSTGIGRGIAIPHCRSLVVSKLRVAFGRKTRRRGLQGDRREAGALLLPDRRAAARGLEPVSARCSGRSRSSRRSPTCRSGCCPLTTPAQFMELLKEKACRLANRCHPSEAKDLHGEPSLRSG